MLKKQNEQSYIYKIVLYSGSFNPVHKGHIALAEYIIKEKLANEVWVLVSPQNPMKKINSLADDDLRLKMTEIAFKSREKIKVSNIEFLLPTPSYTIDTLNFFKNKFPTYTFSLLIGEDNVASFNKWKNYNEILNNYFILVYPRQNDKNKLHGEVNKYKNMRFINAPKIDISSTQIRSMIKQGVSVEGLTPLKVIDFIKKHNLYLT